MDQKAKVTETEIAESVRLLRATPDELVDLKRDWSVDQWVNLLLIKFGHLGFSLHMENVDGSLEQAVEDLARISAVAQDAMACMIPLVARQRHEEAVAMVDGRADAV
jgi:hypothetical protein